MLDHGIAVPQPGLLSQASSLRLPSGHSGPVFILSNAAHSSLLLPSLLVGDASIWAVAPVGVAVRHVICGFQLFIYFSSQLFCPLKFQGSPQTHQRDCFLVFGNFSLFQTPFLGPIYSFVSLFIFYILFYLLLKTMVCFSGCLMSSVSIQKLFCGICSALKCSFDEFVGEKVVSPSYSSAILGLPRKRNSIQPSKCTVSTHCERHWETVTKTPNTRPPRNQSLRDWICPVGV